ncbi:MAG: hypothetical protein ACKOWG_03155 [Planctomycetia bacterium]
MSSSSKDAKLRRKEREWKPKLKDSGRKAVAAGSATSQAAQLAMTNIKDIGRRRDRGQDVDDAYLAKVSQAIDPTAALKQQQAAAARNQARGLPGWAYGLAAAGIGCLLLWAGATVLRGAAHSVAGTVWLNQQPLADVELCFHPAQSGAAPTRIKTASDGTFALKTIPAGSYKVTLRAEEGTGVGIPAPYADPKSTKFRMKIERDLPNVSFYVR